jgi:hypothetical protein
LALDDLELHALDLVVKEAIKRHDGCRIAMMRGRAMLRKEKGKCCS